MGKVRLDTNLQCQTAALLFSEYICLAIMSFPWSYSVLGLVPGLILTIVIAGIVLYTSLIVWYVPYTTLYSMQPRIADTYTSTGDFVCDTPRSATSAILASISSGIPRLPGGVLRSCFY